MYKNDVAGAVLIDGSNLDAYAHHIDTPDFLKGPWQQTFGSFSSKALAAACLGLPTIQRLSYLAPKFGKPRPTPSYGLAPDQHEELDFLSDHAYADACYVDRNEADVLAAGDFGDRPLIVLASTRQRSGDGKALQEWNDWWVRREQPSLAALSSKGRLNVVEGQVGLESIVGAVQDVVKEVAQ